MITTIYKNSPITNKIESSHHKTLRFVGIYGVVNNYNIVAPYNTFTIVENSISISASVTAGNYNIVSLLAALTTSLNALATNVYSFSYSTTTGKTTVTRSSGALAWYITPKTSDITRKLGFTVDTTAGTGPFTGDSGINLSLIYEIWIYINNARTNYYTETTMKTVQESPLRLIVPLVSTFGMGFSFNSQSEAYAVSIDNYISNVKVEIRDPNNNYSLVNNNGQPLYVQMMLSD